jgi:4-amino-4-deoxy-L-arabinose transferase-like glycosyltransferase
MREWQDRKLGQLGVIVLTALLSKLLIFTDVAVNGDTGLYLYDAQQITWGKQIFVDFPSRSPVMEYLLAGVVSVSPSPIIGARAFMLMMSLAVGVAVYAVAREIHSHRAGLVAAAIWYFTPFTMVWSLWIKTEVVAALFLLVAFWLVLRVLDAEEVSLPVMVMVGTLFGTAFLIRRVAIVHIGAFGIFWLGYRYREGYSTRNVVTPLSAAAAATVGTLVTAYLLLAGFDLRLAGEIARVHAVALVESSGQGSLGWVGLEDHSARMAESRGGFLAQICQKCGIRTLEVWQQTWRVTLPVTLSLLVGLRSFIRVESRFFGDWALPTAIGVAGGFGLVSGLLSAQNGQALVSFVLLAGVAVVWLGESPDWEDWYDLRMGLPVLILTGLTAGYLYRDRIQYVTYFQDFMPFLAILAGVCIVGYVEVNRTKRWLVVGGTMLLILSVAVGLVFAFPYQPNTKETDWMTIDHVQDYGDMMDERVAPGERIVTAQPLYVIESDRRIVANLSRRYYAFRQFPGSNKAEQTEATLVEEIESGNVPIAITDINMKEIFNESATVEQRITNCYERVANKRINDTGGQLHELRGCE